MLTATELLGTGIEITEALTKLILASADEKCSTMWPKRMFEVRSLYISAFISRRREVGSPDLNSAGRQL